MAEVETFPKAMIKYLSVEGEIKVGDYFIDNSRQLILCIDKIMLETKNNLTLAKPFVVTQDFEMGDVVTAINGASRFVTKLKKDTLSPDIKMFVDDGKISGEHPSTSCYYKEYYKILGEVSPKATFVEDGKECEVERCITVEISPNGDEKRYYKIKCPKRKKFY